MSKRVAFSVGCSTFDVRRFLSPHGRVAESGLRHSTRNRAWGNPPWVRIPPLPPYFLTNARCFTKRRLEQSWLRHRQCSRREGAMIRANCRARFTAADFDFIVRTLARSPNDHVSLVDLL